MPSQTSLFPDPNPPPRTETAEKKQPKPILFTPQLASISITITDVSHLTELRAAALRPGGAYSLKVTIGTDEDAEQITLPARYRIDKQTAQELATHPFVTSIKIPK